MRYTLCINQGITGNIIFAYSPSVQLDNSVRVVGNFDIPEEAITGLNFYEDRRESGIKLCPIGKLEKEINTWRWENDEEMRAHLSEQVKAGLLVDLDILEEAWHNAILVDVDFYLNESKGEISCKKSGESDLSVGGNYLGTILRIPRTILKKETRYICGSVRDDARRFVKPQILIPEKSVLNHAYFGLGRYDKS